MERLDALAEDLRHVATLLSEDVLEPDPARTDWAGLRVRVGMVREGMERILGPLEATLEEAEEAELQARIRERVAQLTSRAAALLFTAGQPEVARPWMERAVALALERSQRALLETGLTEPELFRDYVHGLWLNGRGRAPGATEVLGRVVKKSRQKVLQQAARASIPVETRPVERAPHLMTINGCGTLLYGKRDEHPDGTYVATLCICLLFIPVFPLKAYRVRHNADGAYQFHAQEPLGPVARLWQRLMLVGAACALLGTGAHQYWTSPGRLARVALEDAQAAESSLPREQALERYRAVIEQHPDAAVRSRAAQDVVRLSLAGLPDLCTHDAVAAVERMVTGLEALPPGCLQGAPATRLAEWLEACSVQIGQASREDTHAALDVVRAALRVAPQSTSLQTRRLALQRVVADGLVRERPLQALALYVELPGRSSLDAARAVLDTLGGSPSLWLEASASVEAWLSHPDQELAQSPGVARYRERLAAARATHTRDEALLETEDEAKIRQAFEAHADDQELAAAMATRMRARGETQEALRLLLALGPEGRLTSEARMLRGLCHRDLGQLAEADAVLSSLVFEGLVPFLSAQQRYERAERVFEEQLLAQARHEPPPRQLEEKLREASGDEEMQRAFHEWMAQRMESNTELERMRGEVVQHQAVVSAALTLGMVKLERAQAAEGEVRHTLLSEAERLFLSIQHQAEGDPSFHLGLGQVYHRLGRVEEGDRELHGLLERKEPVLTLRVAHAYRELDRIDQARALGQQVYDTSSDTELKYEAATLMARLATDVDEEEQWLLREDPHSAAVRNDLLGVRAHRALREGRLEEADRDAARVADFRSVEARHNASAANNTAMALMMRYEATGDVEHLRASVQYLETALRLAPDNALVMGNLADAHQYLGHVTVLEHWVRTRPLRLDSGQAQRMLDVLLDSPLREDVLRAMAVDPALRRSLELSQQEQTLSPAKGSAWERQLHWLQQRRDVPGLRALARRMETLPPFTGSTEAETRRRRESKAMDAQMSRWAQQRVTASEATVKRAEQAHHAPTLAMAWALLGEARLFGRVYDPGLETLDALGEAYRQSEKLWPALGPSRELPRVLAQVALERGAAKSEELARLWKAEGREQGAMVVLHHVLASPKAPEATAVLRAQPELKEAAEHARQRARTAPEVADWVLARAAGDVVLEQAAAAVFARPDVEVALALDTQLAGDHPRERAEQSLFQQGKALQSRP